MLKLSVNNSLFPKRLERLHKPPKTLYVKSDNWEELKDSLALAIVGSRRPSPYGRAVCIQIATEAAKRGVVIISGLALGVDGYAHKAALEAGGKTVAVLPSGLNNVYPASHKNLADQILMNKGALVSIYRPEEKIAYKGNFIARNRIIAGLADALLIPEAAEGSGSLHTAQFAVDIGLEVMAVPGQINNPLARGTNNLIKSGANMVTNISDVLDALNINDKATHKPNLTLNNAQEVLIIEAIARGIYDGDDILADTGLNIELYNQTITMLEINGHIKPGGANTWFLN